MRGTSKGIRLGVGVVKLCFFWCGAAHSLLVTLTYASLHSDPLKFRSDPVFLGYDLVKADLPMECVSSPLASSQTFKDVFGYVRHCIPRRDAAIDRSDLWI